MKLNEKLGVPEGINKQASKLLKESNYINLSFCEL
jgi:hypothetical protein